MHPKVGQPACLANLKAGSAQPPDVPVRQRFPGLIDGAQAENVDPPTCCEQSDVV
jgi:hypothetical protein